MHCSVAVLFGLLLIGSCQASDVDDKAFDEYLQKYKLRLGRSDDAEKLKEIFKERSKEIENHNKEFKKGRTSYELTLDEYSLLPYEELIKSRTGYIPSPPNDTEAIPAENDKRRGGRAAPSSHSWLNYPGVVKPVQDQKSCGSCWAFAGIGALEGQIALKLGKTDKLSEQEVIECARNRQTNVLLGCNGGWHFSVYDHAASRNGITSSSYKPYLAHTYYGCNPYYSRSTGSKTKGYYNVQAGNEEAMKQTLYSTGPLYVSFYVSNDLFSYKSGVYTDSKGLCKPSYWNNHAVLLVGYGTQNGIDYWLLKNSWGTSFGESGYFKLQRGRNLCGIANDVTYPALA